MKLISEVDEFCEAGKKQIQGVKKIVRSTKPLGPFPSGLHFPDLVGILSNGPVT